MRLDVVFRLSTYLTLAVASLCLGYAEDGFLPGILLFSGLMALILVAAFFLEGRWALTRRAANVLGILIGAGSGLWIAYHAVRLPQQLKEVAPGPAAMLPYFGPVLMVLLLAKLFRPKRVNDFWLLHLIGLMEATLGCVLTGDLLFGGLLAVYLGCALWSLILFFLYRQHKAVQRSFASEAAATPNFPWRFWGIGAAGRFGLAALSFGLILFLLTPQHGDSRWDTFSLSRRGNAPIQSGFSGDIDLNRTGKVTINREVAMEVMASGADHQPKLDLNLDQRWRGGAMEDYDQGRWHPHGSRGAIPWPMETSRQQWERQSQFPDLGPDKFFLDFTVDLRLTHELFLAEPLVTVATTPKLPPVFSLTEEMNHPLELDAAHLSLQNPHITKCNYRQVTLPMPEPDLGPPLEAGPTVSGRPPLVSFVDARIGMVFPRGRLNPFLVQTPPPLIGEETRKILERLVAGGKLSREDAEHQGPLPQERWEKVAKALSDYLAFSGDYKYTLDLRRKDQTIDPAEDFLCNVKQGHCELYATALVLMLRSCRIPSRIVVGFRGAESIGDGQYIVRQSHAHSWAEALIPRTDSQGNNEWHWLTLDSTPSDESIVQDSTSWELMWEESQTRIRSVWKNFILEYNTDQQEEVASALWTRLEKARPAKEAGAWGLPGLSRFASCFWLLLVVSLVLVIGLAIRLKRRRKPTLPTAALVLSSGTFYARLLEVLDRRCRLRPRLSQTPQEFGDIAELALLSNPPGASVADIPQKVIRLFYRVRFGHRPLTLPENLEIDLQVSAMDAALAVDTPAQTKLS